MLNLVTNDVTLYLFYEIHQKPCFDLTVSRNSLISRYITLLILDYFEIERLIEELAKLYSCSCATSWFKVNNQWNPTRDEFRNKVVEFMNHFEYTLSTYPDTPESEKFKNHTRELLQNETKLVLKGDNKDVEKRYNYFVGSR